jgi:hypothetical protein
MFNHYSNIILYLQLVARGFEAKGRGSLNLKGTSRAQTSCRALWAPRGQRALRHCGRFVRPLSCPAHASLYFWNLFSVHFLFRWSLPRSVYIPSRFSMLTYFDTICNFCWSCTSKSASCPELGRSAISSFFEFGSYEPTPTNVCIDRTFVD